MGIFFIIIIVLIIFFAFIGNISNNDKKKIERQKVETEAKLKSGDLIRCNDNVLRTKLEFELWESQQKEKAKNHPDYKYLRDNGILSYQILDIMTLAEIIKSCRPYREKEKLEEERRRKEQHEKLLFEQLERKKPLNNIIKKVSEIQGNVGGIYMIYCQFSEEFYIGSALQISKRVYQHLNKLRKGDHVTKKLQKAFDEYGEINFEFYLVKEIEIDCTIVEDEFLQKKIKNMNYKNLHDSEQYYINLLEPPYNSTNDVYYIPNTYNSRYRY